MGCCDMCRNSVTRRGVLAYQIGLHVAKSGNEGAARCHREGMPMNGAPAAQSGSAPSLPGPSGGSYRRAEMGRSSFEVCRDG
eukprot:scaffold100464_cov63-Phaeocystis_antarctica.AAC.1